MNDFVKDLKYYFSYAYIWRQYMFFTFWRYRNFGATFHGGVQFFELKVIPTANVKSEYVLNQYYNTNEIVVIGSYFVLFDDRKKGF